MATPPEDEEQEALLKEFLDGKADEKKGRKRKKLSKDRRAKEAKRKLALEAAERGEDPEPTASAKKGGNKAEGEPKKKKGQESGGHDNDLDNRAWVGGLPDDTDEQLLLEHFSASGAIRSIKLIKDTRLRFRGSCFINFKKDRGLQAALELDKSLLQGQLISVRKAAAPIEAADLKVYVGGLPWKATEEVLRKDFSECGEISKFHMLRDKSEKNAGKFKGVVFMTFKTKAGVDAALKFNDTDYGGKIICVRLASTKKGEGSRRKRPREPVAEEDVAAEETSQQAGSKESAVKKIGKAKRKHAADEEAAAEESSEKASSKEPATDGNFFEMRAKARKARKVPKVDG